MFVQQFLACACAVTVATVAAADYKCSDEVVYGICTDGTSTEVVKYVMYPGVGRQTYELGPRCGGYGGVSGVRAIACDYDVPPSVAVASLSDTQVVRHSDLSEYAAVSVTACCYY